MDKNLTDMAGGFQRLLDVKSVFVIGETGFSLNISDVCLLPMYDLIISAALKFVYIILG